MVNVNLLEFRACFFSLRCWDRSEGALTFKWLLLNDAFTVRSALFSLFWTLLCVCVAPFEVLFTYTFNLHWICAYDMRCTQANTLRKYSVYILHSHRTRSSLSFPKAIRSLNDKNWRTHIFSPSFFTLFCWWCCCRRLSTWFRRHLVNLHRGKVLTCASYKKSATRKGHFVIK